MKTVLASGVFDLLHPGHIEHLRQARAMGGRLVVSITGDAFVRKGPGRPCFSQERRARQLAELRCVDEVQVTLDASALPAIEAYRPDIYVKGADYRDRTDGVFARERAAVEAYGGAVAFTDGFTASSSALINGHVREQPEAVRLVRDRWGIDGVLGWLDKAAALKAFAVGEPIIDEYVDVSPAGKSAKEDLVVYRQQRVQRWDGGVRAVAEHMRGLGLDVWDTHSLMAPVVKRRYVSQPFAHKLFAVSDDGGRRDRPTLEWTEGRDLAVVADYGHGMFPTPGSTREVSGHAHFLALTVQSNSLNWGFNLVTKWERADYVVVDEPELRLAAGDQDGELQPMVRAMRRRLGAKLFAVTLGHRGCLVYDGEDWTEMPPLADKVVDRIGAGDAFLAYSAPLAAVGAPAEIVALVGNAAGGLQVGVIGNSQPVSRRKLERVLRSVLA